MSGKKKYIIDKMYEEFREKKKEMEELEKEALMKVVVWVIIGSIILAGFLEILTLYKKFGG